MWSKGGAKMPGKLEADNNYFVGIFSIIEIIIVRI